jgi:hypothetical protein
LSRNKARSSRARIAIGGWGQSRRRVRIAIGMRRAMRDDSLIMAMGLRHLGSAAITQDAVGLGDRHHGRLAARGGIDAALDGLGEREVAGSVQASRSISQRRHPSSSSSTSFRTRRMRADMPRL